MSSYQVKLDIAIGCALALGIVSIVLFSIILALTSDIHSVSYMDPNTNQIINTKVSFCNILIDEKNHIIYIKDPNTDEVSSYSNYVYE